MTRSLLAMAVIVLGTLGAADAQVFKPRTKNGPAKAIVSAATKGAKAVPDKAPPIAAAATKTQPKLGAPAKKPIAKRPIAKTRPTKTSDDDDVVVVDDDDDDE